MPKLSLEDRILFRSDQVGSLIGLGETVAVPNDRSVSFLTGIKEIHSPIFS